MTLIIEVFDKICFVCSERSSVTYVPISKKSELPILSESEHTVTIVCCFIQKFLLSFGLYQNQEHLLYPPYQINSSQL